MDEATVFADFNGRTIGECVLSAWHVYWDILEVLKRPQIGRIRKEIASEIGTSSIRQFINSPPSKREAGETLFFWSNFLIDFDAHTRCECAPGYVGPSRCSRSWRDVAQSPAKASVLLRDFCGAKQGKRLRGEFEKLHKYHL